MSAPSMKPMEVKFKNNKERQKFINMAESNKKTNSPRMDEIRRGVKEARKMRKSGTFKF
ncbi:hypothetical protein [Halalkalibacter sp. APA_J-10(15)]|uniref:hypothetical protein n=1 Tax=Halalkalibacter sp. APA_J-10(15) TaxID=2933805 RepID=UPI001FF35A4E|nr:hypothetical protein [Halalkalibacter sp. APA_J-10(15)]MCK0470874.1 hypothetical protein [Halalkalibacter sp. APA_J-10(15)]